MRRALGDKAKAAQLFLARRVPSWAGRTALLAAAYVAIMYAVALWVPAWHDWDWRFFDSLSSRVAPTLSQDVTIVDFTWSKAESAIPSDRLRIASFLNGLVRNNEHPAAVILDVEFDPCGRSCSPRMLAARDSLVAAIRNATRNFPVYGTEEFPLNRELDIATGPVDPLDPSIYAALDGAGHTRFTGLPNEEGLFYRLCYPRVPFVDSAGNVDGTEDVWSMVDRVLLLPSRPFAAMPACDTDHVPVRLGPKISPAPPQVYHFTDPRRFSSYAQLDGTYVIAGTIQDDPAVYAGERGPELLAWAMSDALDQRLVPGYYDVQPQNRLLLLLIPTFSGLAVVIYAASFFLLKRTRLRSARRLLPSLSALIAVVVGLGTFVIFESWLFLAHHIQPQVSLIGLGIVVASGLSGVRGSQVLRDEAEGMDWTPVETYDYDIFISYAHEDGAWVYENVYVPFRDAVLPNGKKLAVFFDTSSILGGSGWQAKISFAIDASRFVVPVYTEIYFTKPYCRFEIMRAHRKWIRAGGMESRIVLPVMRGKVNIYGAVDDIQAPSLDEHPELVREYVDEIVERLSREPPAMRVPS